MRKIYFKIFCYGIPAAIIGYGAYICLKPSDDDRKQYEEFFKQQQFRNEDTNMASKTMAALEAATDPNSDISKKIDELLYNKKVTTDKKATLIESNEQDTPEPK